ncbi:MAG: hypothetical protein ACR2KK_13295 [Acidimicrobiales bacterium]
MTIGVDPPDAREQARIAVVHAFDILDKPPDGTFDRIDAVAARTFDVPIGIVSIVDTDRIWFKAHHGLRDVERIDRELGLCASAILHDSRGWSWMPRPTPAR